jgi:predicted HTH transcriptional regulator
LNGEGGDLIIGVDDTKVVLGLNPDYESSKSIRDRDGFERHLNAIVRKAVGDATLSFIAATFHTISGKQICQVSIDPADHPVYVQTSDSQSFFLRQGNATRSLDPKETLTYASTHWR